MNADTSTSKRERRTPLGQLTAAILIVGALCGLIALGGDGAPVRGRIARVRTDMRSIALALEAYRSDHGFYPAAHTIDLNSKARAALKDAGCDPLNAIDPTGFIRGKNDALTTSTYLTFVPNDIFAPLRDIPFRYRSDAHGWILVSPGPDGDYDLNPARDYDSEAANRIRTLLPYTYDPTNGTVSDGDLWRVNQ